MFNYITSVRSVLPYFNLLTGTNGSGVSIGKSVQDTFATQFPISENFVIHFIVFTAMCVDDSILYRSLSTPSLKFRVSGMPEVDFKKDGVDVSGIHCISSTPQRM